MFLTDENAKMEVTKIKTKGAINNFKFLNSGSINCPISKNPC